MVEVLGPLKERHHDDVVALTLEVSGGSAGAPPAAAFHWPEEAIRPELKHACGWGLWRDDVLQGFVCWRDLGEEAEITVLATSPSARRRGVMKTLLRQVFDANSYKFWLLEVHEANESARALYEALEFAEVGRRPRYYRDGGSAILYSREGK